ncbi:hypothetical protein Y032_0232g3040 [Ancylostoma ceylanicum]|uniref:Uncharacterized protein n=1 Tax=Ancylostoma ceylanicum TaxID=53326 RepID=A0A016SGJ0_9BILA|nr:hypothetical protein Y032_0232g3040 [Ancylostoma ceylanicum]
MYFRDWAFHSFLGTLSKFPGSGPGSILLSTVLPTIYQAANVYDATGAFDAKELASSTTITQNPNRRPSIELPIVAADSTRDHTHQHSLRTEASQICFACRYPLQTEPDQNRFDRIHDPKSTSNPVKKLRQSIRRQLDYYSHYQ